MNLDAIKNLDIKDLLSKFKGGGGILDDKKLLVKFGIGFGSILLFLIVYYAFVSPIVKNQELKINEMNENKNKITEYSENIISLKKLVKKIEPEFIKSSKLFHNKKEVEDLYQNISKFAMSNGLTIINIKKNEPKAVMGKQATQGTETNQDNQNQENQVVNDPSSAKPLYYKIPVSYKIKGNYLGYLKFRRALSKSNKVINFDLETISVEKETGSILSEGTISIVGLPDEYES
jgi:Tfp pilus assembly protein PilO